MRNRIEGDLFKAAELIDERIKMKRRGLGLEEYGHQQTLLIFTTDEFAD